VAWSIVDAGRESSPNRADTAVVLGAAVHGRAPSPVFEERLRHALELYRRRQVRSIIATGGAGEGMSVAESAAAAAYLEGKGVPRSAIHREASSHTTRQNLVEARRVMRERRLSTALIVSDPLHMKRAMNMARDLGIRAEPSPTPTTRYRTLPTQAPFVLRELYFLHHYWLFRQ